MWPIDYFRMKTAEWRMEREAFEAQRAIVSGIRASEMYEADFSLTAEQKRDIDEWRSWMTVGTGQRGHLSEAQHQKVQTLAYNLDMFNPWARSANRNHVKYVFGRKFRVTIDDPDINRDWQRWARDNEWHERLRHGGLRFYRDGEVIMQRWPRTAEREACYRFIPVDLLSDPGKHGLGVDRHTFGIETLPNDVETPVAYYVRDAKNPMLLRDGGPIPADEVVHWKMNCDAEDKRGVPLIIGAMWILPDMTEILRNRLKLHRIRTAVAAVRRHGSPQEVRDAQARNRVEKDADTTRFKGWKPGTIIDSTRGQAIEFVSPNLQAGDVYNDVRLFWLSVCAACDLAEFMLTADASNSNFASTMMAESPVVRNIEDWQEFFDPKIEREVRWLLGEILDGISEERLRGLAISGEWPPIVHRDVEKETKALSLQHADGILSRRTYQARVGLDPVEEDENLKGEDEEKAIEPVAV